VLEALQILVDRGAVVRLFELADRDDPHAHDA
jgi:hypothetical protein